MRGLAVLIMSIMTGQHCFDRFGRAIMQIGGISPAFNQTGRVKARLGGVSFPFRSDPMLS